MFLQTKCAVMMQLADNVQLAVCAALQRMIQLVRAVCLLLCGKSAGFFLHIVRRLPS